MMKMRFALWALMTEINGATVAALGPALVSLTLVFVSTLIDQ